MKGFSFLFSTLAMFVAFSGCNQASQLAQNLVTVNASWTDSAEAYKGNNGVRYLYVCPPNPSQNNLGAVWGTDIYSDDSAVCVAAVHSGAISFSGGSVTIEIRGGQDSYQGSTQNGVQTLDWTTAWDGSFVIL